MASRVGFTQAAQAATELHAHAARLARTHPDTHADRKLAFLPMAAAMLQTVVALAACALPAWRATKADPMIALRAE